MRTEITPGHGLALLATLLAIALEGMAESGALPPEQAVGSFSILLATYLIAETVRLRADGESRLWLNPVVLASALTFGLPFALSNAVFLASSDTLGRLGFPEHPTKWMARLMFLVMLAATSMWLGYRSGLGRGLGTLLARSRLLRRWVVPEAVVNPFAVGIVILVSLVARLWKIQLGVFGYGGSAERLGAGAEYLEYLSMADSMGRLALAAIALQCFSNPRASPVQRYALWGLTAYEAAFGILAGFKIAIVVPFIVVGVVYYSQKGRFPNWFAPTVASAIILAFAVVEPFRVARNANAQFDGTSLSSIVDAQTLDLTAATGVAAIGETAILFLARANFTYAGSLGIEHVSRGPVREDAPPFLESLVLAPVHALVPRLLWPTKPMQNIGGWYNREVQGNETESSTGMSPITYLNYAGGLVAVILGFLAVGILQRGIGSGLRTYGIGGLLMLLGLLGQLSEIDSAFNTFFVGILRLFPMLLVAQYFLLTKTKTEATT